MKKSRQISSGSVRGYVTGNRLWCSGGEKAVETTPEQSSKIEQKEEAKI